MGVVRALGGDFTIEFTEGYISTYNDPDVTQVIEETVTDLLGTDAIVEPRMGMGAEDFSYMTRKAPGAMFMLGAQLDEVARGHHTPIFDIHEDALPTGTAILAEATCRLLRQHGG